MRGYFALGAVGVDKPRNVGALFRTAHAFGASFVFTIAAAHRGHPDAGAVEADLTADIGLELRGARSVDTSDAAGALPYFAHEAMEDFAPPAGCALIGVEIDDQAVVLPSFRHPRRAAYLVGSERRGLSSTVRDRCDHLVRIPTQFSVNLSVAAAIVLYDRMISLGRFAERPVRAGGPAGAAPRTHIHGGPTLRREKRLKADEPVEPAADRPREA
ncbi:MAG: TrmH family RNA methyltransferase [Pseudomonadota bacterium]